MVWGQKDKVRQIATTQTEVTKKLNWSQLKTRVFNLESKLKQNNQEEACRNCRCRRWTTKHWVFATVPDLKVGILSPVLELFVLEEANN